MLNCQTRLLGEHSEREPPDPIPNSEVKPLSADDSVAGCHVKVGHRQALKLKALPSKGFFYAPLFIKLRLCEVIGFRSGEFSSYERQGFISRSFKSSQ